MTPFLRPACLILALVSPAVSWASGCTVAQLDESVDNAEDAFADLRVDDFEVSLDQIDLLLDCLEGTVTTETAARVHRVKGIVAFAADQEDRAAFSLTAARLLDPGHPMPDSLVPVGHPVRVIYDEVDLSDDPMMSVPEATAGWLAFDGSKGLDRPLARASVIQVFDHEGQPRTARYLYPGDPLPPYPGSLAPRLGDGLGDPAPQKKRFPLLGVAGAGMLVAGAGGLFAAQAQSDDMQNAASLTELDEAYGRQKMFGYGGYALIGAGFVGLTVEVAL